MKELFEPLALMLTEPLMPLIPKSILTSLSQNLSVLSEKPKPKVYLAISILVSLILFMLSFLGFIYQPLFLLFPSSILIFSLRLFYPSYRASEVSKKIFEEMPSYLLSASSLIQAGETPEEAFAQLSQKIRHKNISSIFLQTIEQSSRKRTELGQSLVSAISKYNSPELNRTALLLAAGITSGSNLHSLFNTVARDLLTIRQLRQQQTQQMASLKYTLILSGGVLIPAILTYTIKVSNFIAAQTTGLRYASLISFVPLSFILGLIIALFCDFQPRKSVLYIPIFLIIQFLVFQLL